MIAPIFVLDSRERWRPRAVESVNAVGATLNGHPIDLGHLPDAGGRMDFPASMVDTGGAVVGYHRVVSAANLFWHQFWLWYLYNPKAFLGAGEHEGDWEFVQIATVEQAGDHPVLVAGSQHQSGAKRELWACELDHGRPVIYVALGSQANYFTAFGNLEDESNGKGERLTDIEWRAFAPWASWSGRWGNSTGAGKSPQSPGRQGDRWLRPHVYHSSCR